MESGQRELKGIAMPLGRRGPVAQIGDSEKVSVEVMELDDGDDYEEGGCQKLDEQVCRLKLLQPDVQLPET